MLTTRADRTLTSVCRLAAVVNRRSAQPAETGQIRSGGNTVTWDKRDRYGRIIGKISVDHRDVCLEQVRRGMAWHYKQYARDQSPDDRGVYAEAEVAARAARLGLWHDVASVPPCEWRHKK